MFFSPRIFYFSLGIFPLQNASYLINLPPESGHESFRLAIFIFNGNRYKKTDTHTNIIHVIWYDSFTNFLNHSQMWRYLTTLKVMIIWDSY